MNSNFAVYLFIALLILTIIYVILTYFNSRLYNEVCEQYKNKYGEINPGAISFKYFNFNFIYISMPNEKFKFVYSPLLLRKHSPLNKIDSGKWYKFINTRKTSVKVWFYAELITLLICMTIFFVLLTCYTVSKTTG